MSNMSYCRFENTARDFADCVANMDADSLSESEARAREDLIQMAVEMALNYGAEIGREVEEVE